MSGLDYWKAKLKVALLSTKQREKESTQAHRTFVRALEEVAHIQKRIEDEKIKLAKTE
jgi:hypothetical protein